MLQGHTVNSWGGEGREKENLERLSRALLVRVQSWGA